MEVIHWADHDSNMGHGLKGPVVLCRGVSGYYMIDMIWYDINTMTRVMMMIMMMMSNNNK